MNKLILISGCSSAGKSSLLSALSEQGYSVVPEVGRELVKEQLAINSGITPWQEPLLFCEMLIQRSIEAYSKGKNIKNPKKGFVFFDRSFLEGVCYYQKLKITKYDHLIGDLRFFKIMFMVPPWKEIFCEDGERKGAFENAVEEYNNLLDFYPKQGYRILELPKMSISERVKFMLSSVD